MEVEEQIILFKEFIELNCKEQLLNRIKKEERFLVLDFKQLAQTEPTLASDVLDNTESTMRAAEIAIEQFDVLGDVNHFKVRFENVCQSTNKDIWRIRAKDIEKFVTIKGYLRKVGDVQHRIHFARYECNSCANIINVLQNMDELKKPRKCGCGSTSFRLIHRELKDIQKIVIEEDPLNFQNHAQKPRSMLVILEDDLTRAKIDETLQPSKKISVSGIVLDKPVKERSVEYKKYLVAHSIDVVSNTLENIKISDLEIQQFKQMAESSTLFEDLAQSITPNIEGHLSARIALVLQLVGAVELFMDGVLEERGQISILLVGSPGSGKSVMLKRSILFLPGSRFSAGKNASGVGLVASVTKDEELGGYVLSAGSMAMASGAILCIEENQTMITKGGFKKISDIKTRDELISYTKHSTETNIVTRVTDNGFRELLAIETYNGAIIKCTPNHKILTHLGWKQASELTSRDYIKIPTITIRGIEHNIEFKEGFLDGFIVSDVHKSNFSVADKNHERTEYVLKLIKELCDMPQIHKYRRDNKDVRFGNFGPTTTHFISGDKFKDMSKKAFECNHRLSQEYIIGFLSGIINTDCSISHKHGKYGIKQEIAITLSRKKTPMDRIIDYVRDLFCMIGIFCVRRRKRLIISSLQSYNLFVKIFKEHIVLTSKREKCEHYTAKSKISSYDCRYDQEVTDWFKSIKFNTTQTVKLGLHSRIWSVKQNEVITTYLLETLKPYWKQITKMPYREFNKNYMLNKVISIKKILPGRVYDITMEDAPNFYVSGGVVHNCIDEIDKMSKTDLAHMNNAIVDMKVTIDKADIHQVIETNTAVLAAANPKNRVFDPREPIWKQIGLPKDFLDRFDLIFPVLAPKSDSEKKKIANLVVGKYIQSNKDSKPLYPRELMIKYIAYAKRLKPQITESVKEYIVENFLNLVKPSDPDEDAAYFSYRLLTNIIRLTQAVAKTRLSDTILESDAQRAINILIESLKMQDIITSDNLFDYERAEAITPKRKRDIVYTIKKIVRDLMDCDVSEQLADYDDILKKSLENGIEDVDILDKNIEKLKLVGDLIEVRRNKYKIQ